MISIVEPQPAGADLVAQVEEIFSPTGILSRAKNFEFRPQQQQMAVAVARALQNREHLAVEAGTGVGKSLAYLVPAILYAVANKKRAVISTHTINLQEQLTEEELQRIQEWSRKTADGSLSDFEVEPDPKVWAQVCSERGLCSPKMCGYASE